MSRRIVIGIVLSLLAFAGLSQGIQDSVFHIEQVDVRTSAMFRKEEAGMRETQIDTSVLRTKVHRSLSEVLSENTSVFIRDHGRGALATASFRGTAASHTRVLWNGIPINAPMTGMVDFSLIPVHLIDELSLKHGTASIAEGSGGLGGAIHIRNRTSFDRSLKVRYVQSIGSYGTHDEFLQLGGGSGKIQVKTRVYNNYSDNDYTFINRATGSPDPETGAIIHPLDTNDRAHYRKYGLLQELYFRPTPGDLLSAIYWVQYADRTIPRATSYEGPDHSNLNQQSDTDHKLVARWNRYGDRTRLNWVAGYTTRKLDYTLKNSVPGLGEVPVIFSESRQHSSLNSLSYAYDPVESWSLEGQLEARYHQVRSMDTVSGAGYSGDRFEAAVLVGARRSFAGLLNLNLMLRQEWLDGNRAPLVPYLGFDLRLRSDSTFLLKGNIARNFRQPSMNDLHWQPGGNPDLLPEKGWSGEIGVEYMGDLIQQSTQMEVTLFHSDIHDWILWIPGYKGYWEPRNVERVLSRGIEFSLSLHGKVGWLDYRTSGTYAFTSSKNLGDPAVWGDRSYGKQMVYIPKHSGNLLVQLGLKGFYLTFQHNSYSERFTTVSNDVTRRDWLYPYFMNDLSLGKEFLWKNYRFTTELKVYNLFNENYHTVLYRPMPGRNYMILLFFDF